MKIKKEDATPDQLRAFATDVLGIAVKPQTPKPVIIAKIEEAGHEDPTIEVPDEPQPPAAPPPEAAESAEPVAKHPEHDFWAAKGLIMGPKGKVKFKIPATPENRQDVQVAVNGRHCIIKRGVEVAMHPSYVEALRHAKTLEPEQDENDRILAWHEVPTYTIEITGAE